MELKAGMPIWAKENIQDFTKGKKYVLMPFENQDWFYVKDDVNDTFAVDEEYITHHFTTTPPKEETEHCERLCSDNYCDENGCVNRKRILTEPIPPLPVFKSLEEIKDEEAKEIGYEGWDNCYSTLRDFESERYSDTTVLFYKINNAAERHATQYREAYEAEKAENLRLKNEIEKLKNSSL